MRLSGSPNPYAGIIRVRFNGFHLRWPLPATTTPSTSPNMLLLVDLEVKLTL